MTKNELRQEICEDFFHFLSNILNLIFEQANDKERQHIDKVMNILDKIAESK